MTNPLDVSLLLLLVSAYLKFGAEGCRLLRKKFTIEGDLLRAWKRPTLPESLRCEAAQEAVPKRGILCHERQVSYAFHGVGCRFTIGGQIVDVDFGPDGRHDGFDAWRLFKFAETSQITDHFSSASEIQTLLDQLEHEGAIVRLPRSLSSHLYYFKSAIDDHTLNQWGESVSEGPPFHL